MFEKLKYFLLEYKPRVVCTKCSEEKCCDEFYWKIKGTRRMAECKKCRLVVMKKYARTEAGKASQKKYDRTAKVKARKKKYAGTAKAKATRKKYAGTEAGKAARKKAAKKHRGTAKGKASDKKYVGTAKGKETQKKAVKKYQRTAKGKEAKKKAIKKYQRSPKGKAAKARANAKRRSKIEGIINNLTKEQWLQILEDQKHCCNGCKISFSEETSPTKDHIIPVDKDGGLTKENTQVLCKSCNSIKGAESMDYLVEVLEKKEIE